jgi:hypothetical protein
MAPGRAITLDTVVAMPFLVNRSNGEFMDSADYGRFRLDLGGSECIACAGLATGNTDTGAAPGTGRRKHWSPEQA